MRVYIGGLWQESNTFCPFPTELDQFDRGYRLRGREIIDKLGGTNTEIGGMLEFLVR